MDEQEYSDENSTIPKLDEISVSQFNGLNYDSKKEGYSVLTMLERNKQLDMENTDLRYQVYFLEEALEAIECSKDVRKQLREYADLKVEHKKLQEKCERYQSLLAQDDVLLKVNEERERLHLTIKQLREYFERDDHVTKTVFDEICDNFHVETVHTLVETLNLKLEEEKTENMKMNEKCEMYEQKIVDYEDHIETLSKDIETKACELSDLKAKLLDAERECVVMDQQLQLRARQIDTLTMTFNEKCNALNDKVKILSDIQNDLDQQCQLINKLKDDLKERDARVNELEKELERERRMSRASALRNLRPPSSHSDVKIPVSSDEGAAHTSVLFDRTFNSKSSIVTCCFTSCKVCQEAERDVDQLKAELSLLRGNERTHNEQIEEMTKMNRKQMYLIEHLYREVKRLKSASSSESEKIENSFAHNEMDIDEQIELLASFIAGGKVDNKPQQVHTVTSHGDCNNESSPTNNNNHLHEQIVQLQHESQEMRAHKDETNKVCRMLIERLQELAKFLKSLLSDSNVLVLFNKKAARHIERMIDDDLRLSETLLTNPSMTLDTINASFKSMSLQTNDPLELSGLDQSLLLDQSKIRAFTSLLAQDQSRTEENRSRNKKTPTKTVDFSTDDEEWSEPDRSVSMARIGLNSSNPSALVESSTDQQTKATDDCPVLPAKVPVQLESKMKSYGENYLYLLEKIRLRDKEIAQLHEQLAKYSNSSVDNRSLNRVEELESKLEALLADKKLLVQEVDELGVQNKSLNELLDEKIANLHELQHTLTFKESENEQMRVELEKSRATIEQFNNACAEHERNVTVRFENDLRKYQESVRELNERLEELTATTVSRLVYDDKVMELEQLTAMYHMEKDKLYQKDEIIKKINDDIEDVRRDCAMKMNETEMENGELRAKIAELNEQLEAVTMDKQELTETIHHLQSQIDEHRVDLVTKMKEFEEIVETNRKIHEQLGHVDAERRTHELRASELQNVNAELHGKIARLQSEYLRAWQQSDDDGGQSNGANVVWVNGADSHENSLSPDLGIDSDPHAPYEPALRIVKSMRCAVTKAVNGSCSDLDALDLEALRGKIRALECELAKKTDELERTKHELAKINRMNRTLVKQVCKQLHKTEVVLHKAKVELDTDGEK